MNKEEYKLLNRKFDFNKPYDFLSDVEVEAYTYELIGNKLRNKYIERATVSNIIKTLIYYQIATKDKKEQTLNNLVNEIKLYLNEPDCIDNFFNTVKLFPIDHPAKFYNKSIENMEKKEFEEAVLLIEKLVKKKTK